MQITIDTTEILQRAEAMLTPFDRESATPQQCRIRANQQEQMVVELQAVEAAIKLSEQRRVNAEIERKQGRDEWDGMTDLDGEALSALTQTMRARQLIRHFESSMEMLERTARKKELV